MPQPAFLSFLFTILNRPNVDIYVLMPISTLNYASLHSTLPFVHPRLLLNPITLFTDRTTYCQNSVVNFRSVKARKQNVKYYWHLDAQFPTLLTSVESLTSVGSCQRDVAKKRQEADEVDPAVTPPQRQVPTMSWRHNSNNIAATSNITAVWRRLAVHWCLFWAAV